MRGGRPGTGRVRPAGEGRSHRGGGLAERGCGYNGVMWCVVCSDSGENHSYSSLTVSEGGSDPQGIPK